MIVIEGAIFILVFGAVLAAYRLGRSEAPAPHQRSELDLVHEYRPPIIAFLEYRNESGKETITKNRLLKSQRHRDGRLYLFGLCGIYRKPRLFRVDRIISIATTDGEVLDTQRFLTKTLAIPPNLCPAPAVRGKDRRLHAALH